MESVSAALAPLSCGSVESLPGEYNGSAVVLDSPLLKVGAVVVVKVVSCRGRIRYIGPAQRLPGSPRESSPSDLWVGVELERPVGKNNGSAFGRPLFSCAYPHGIFVRPSGVRVVEPAGLCSDLAGSEDTLAGGEDSLSANMYADQLEMLNETRAIRADVQRLSEALHSALHSRRLSSQAAANLGRREALESAVSLHLASPRQLRSSEEKLEMIVWEGLQRRLRDSLDAQLGISR